MRREGDERIKRIQEVAKELSGWKYRLETAEKRNLELVQRQKDNKEQLQNALAEPERLSKRREEIVISISEASKIKMKLQVIFWVQRKFYAISEKKSEMLSD